jgi:signal peptide peptidase SppA
MRDGVAVIPVVGPLFRYANLFTRVSGATSYELLAQDFIAAMENDEVSSIVFTIDSPGGEVNGCAELSQLIADHRGTKPIVAYVSGDAASGAYWIASACDQIITSPTSGLGSIGVVGVYRLNDNDAENTIEIVSSQSPHKRLDLTSDKDKALVQSRIDALAAVFVETVADHRGVDAQTVLEKYGGGDVYIGEQAVTCGLADRLGSFEKTLTELTQKDPATERGFLLGETKNTLTTHEELSMADHATDTHITDDEPLTLAGLKTHYPDYVTAIRAEGYEGGVTDGEIKGATDERQRIGAILSSDLAVGRESLAHHFAFQTPMPVEDVLAALDASPAIEASTPEQNQSSPGFEQVMAGIENPAVEPAADNTPHSEAEQATAMAQRIAGCHKTKRC